VGNQPVKVGYDVNNSVNKWTGQWAETGQAGCP